MIATIILVAFYFAFPVLVIYLCLRYTFLDKIGAVLINYAIGIVIGNLGILPQGSEQLQDLLTTILIPLSIPLLLFSADIKTWLNLVGKTTLSFVLGIIALTISIYVGYYIFIGKIDKIWEISAMLVGVYTGGTPNLASIKTALNVSADRFIITHTSDLIASSLYLLFVLSIAQRLFNLFLPKFKLEKQLEINISVDNQENTTEFKGILAKENRMDILKAVGLSMLIFATGGGLGMLVPEKIMMLVVILTITTLGILFSLRSKVRNLKKSFQTGMYFIHVFSLVVASMADLSKFKPGESIEIFYYVMLVVFGSVLIHLLLAKIFKIDTDTMIITSIALIFSPPFVPVVAGALKNKYIIISGLTVGIIGYAIGNYLGVFIGLSLQ